MWLEIDDETGVPEERVIAKATEAAIGFGSLVTAPEDFSDAVWTKADAGDVIGGSITTPDGNTGTTNGNIADTTDGAHGPQLFFADSSIFTDDTSYTFSVYLKAGNRNWVRLQVRDKAGNYYNSYFDLANGVVGSAPTDDEGIEAVGNGWYRCWVTEDIKSGATSVRYSIHTADDDGDGTITGDGSTVNTYLWGAMLTEGTAPAPYLPLYSNRGYRIVLHDGTYTVWGWIGEPDAVEALGSNLAPTATCTDPDNDQDVTTGWIAAGSATLSSEAGGQTGNCLKVLENGGDSPRGYNDPTVEVGKLYRFLGHHKDIDTTGDDPTFRLESPTGTTVVIETPSAAAAWASFAAYFIAADTTARIRLVHNALNGDSDAYYFDDVYLKEVTAVGLDAVYIYTTRRLTTQSWNGDVADFDWNAMTALEIEQYVESAKGTLLKVSR